MNAQKNSRIANVRKNGADNTTYTMSLILFCIGMQLTSCLAANIDSIDKSALIPKPQILKVSANESQVKRFALVELDVDLTAEYVNPFNPDEVKLEGVFKSPAGRTLIVPGFIWQNYRRSLEKGVEKVSSDGPVQWKVRFTPEEIGEYEYFVRVTNQGKSAESKPAKINVTESRTRGFVRVTSASNRYLACSDGTPYFALGENVCWFSHKGTFDYDLYFEKLAASGCNYTRLWMSPWNIGLEWAPGAAHYGPPVDYPGLGKYNLANAWKLDYIINLAERHGIRIMLCFLVHGEFKTTSNDPRQNMWKGNPYNQLLGGPCEKPQDFFVNPMARDLFKKRLRYMVARWGHSTSVLFWEFFNEVDIIDKYISAEVVSWHRDMARYLRSIDPYFHPITTSYATHAGDPAMWKLPEIDCTQTHFYYADVEGMMERVCREGQSYGKPHWVGEYGTDWQGGRWMRDDPSGIHLHNGLWISALSGDLGNGMLWWWDNYVDPRNLYHHFAALSRFTADIPWLEGNWKSIQIHGCPDTVRAVGIQNEEIALLWFQNRAYTWQACVGGKTVTPVPKSQFKIQNLLPGGYRLEWWDTYLGKTIETQHNVQTENGSIPIMLRELNTDIALKIIRLNAKSSLK